MGKSIVFTVTTDLNHDQRMIRIADTLSRAGYQVKLLGRVVANSRPLMERTFGQYRFSCVFSKGPLFYLEYNLRLVFWFMRHRQFDIIGTVDADTALAGLITSWWSRRPLVYDAHELFPEMPEVVNRPLVRKLWAWLERKAFLKATLAYTVSNSLVSYFEEAYRRPVGLVRNMPFLQPLIVSSQPATPIFIYQGALNVGRGLENSIRAIADVPAKLMICGDGPLAGVLKQMVADLDITEKVIFKGNVDPVTLAQLTKEAYAGLMLLDRQGLSYYYSLANKFFDYVQAGIPQVCVPFPEYLQLNAEHEVAILVENSAAAVKQAMLSLLQEEETYQKLRHNCLVAREQWNWEQEGQKVVEMYRSLGL